MISRWCQPTSVVQLAQRCDAALNPEVLRLVARQLEVANKVRRVPGRRQRATPLRCFVKRAVVVRPHCDLRALHRPQPRHRELGEEYFGLTLCELAGGGSVARTVQEDAV